MARALQKVVLSFYYVLESPLNTQKDELQHLQVLCPLKVRVKGLNVFSVTAMVKPISKPKTLV